MELLSFANYRRYCAVQAKTQKRRTARPGYEWREIMAIARHTTRRRRRGVRRAMCHGARLGGEVDAFRKALPKAKVYGTDLVHRVADKVYRHDFHVQDRLWIGRFDLVYCNSLDHSHAPHIALMVWLAQLAPRGRLYVQWTPWHMTAAGGDCFGAALHEYVSMLNHLGRVEDVLFIHPHKFVVVAVNELGRRRRRW